MGVQKEEKGEKDLEKGKGGKPFGVISFKAQT